MNNSELFGYTKQHKKARFPFTGNRAFCPLWKDSPRRHFALHLPLSVTVVPCGKLRAMRYPTLSPADSLRRMIVFTSPSPPILSSL